MSEEPQRKRIGRPRKYPVDASRITMSFRASSDLHARLVASSAETQRSLSEEVERILETHFQATDLRAIVREEMQATLAGMERLYIKSNGQL